MIEKVRTPMCNVSIIIPTYNCAQYISETIDSALAQTYRDFEIIVVDDGSTDNTKEVLKKYGSQIKLIYQENRGVSAARNIGISRSEGQYVAFLDADDIWLPNKLKAQVEIMNANPDVGLIFTDGVKIDEKPGATLKPKDWRAISNDPEGFWCKIGKAPINDGIILKGNYFKDLLLGNLVFFTSAVLIRKECFENIGYLDEELLSSEDYDLWLRMAYKYPLLYLNSVTSHYRERIDSLCGDRDMRVYWYNKWDGIMFGNYSKFCPPEHREFSIKRACECYKIAIWGYLREGEMDNVRDLCYRFLHFNKKCLKIYVYILISFLPAKFVDLTARGAHRPAARGLRCF